MKKNLCLFLFACSSLWSIAQSNLPTHLLENMNVRSIGPATTSGRVTSIDAVDTPSGYILAGAASGGLWKSYSSGLTWEPIFDEEAVIGIGAVKIDPQTSDVIWVGTGEGNPRNSQTSGKGIYKSMDGGKSWTLKGLDQTRIIHRICVDNKNSNVVFAGAGGSPWGPTPDRGVYKTSDGGDTWTKSLFVNDSVGCADLVMDPSNPNKLFAAMWQYQRQPWFFKSGGKGSGLYRTTDSGKTWKLLGEKEGLPEGPLGRIGIAIAPSNPQIVYAMIECAKTGLYKSTDGGFNWSLVTTEGVDDRPFYYHEFYVDPSNENHLIYLHSTVTESIDGGKNWSTLLPYWGVHPDHHAFWWSKSNSKFMLEGNDGGMNISHDGGRNWRFVNNLPLGQFYHIHYDMDIPYHVYGGMQDNGSWKGVGYTWHEDGIVDADWKEVLFGDGFDVVPNPENSRYLYAMYQGGELYYIDSETGYSTFIKPVAEDSIKLRFNWNSGIAVNKKGLYYGSQFLHYSKDNGMSWEKISADLTTNDATRQKGSESGGLTIDATSAENYCTILSITPSEVNNQVIWVGTDDGNVELTKDHGKSWTNLSASISGFPKNGWIPSIVAGNRFEGEAFVVVNNYRQNDWKPYLFHTTDFGKTWKNLVNEKSVQGHCLSVVQDPIVAGLLFLGTEHGLYVSIDYGKTWTKWAKNYPSVATQDLKIHPREGDLIIGTFGRAAYVIDDLRPLRDLAMNQKDWSSKKLIAVDSPDAFQVFKERPRGQRFPADAGYEGADKPTSASLNYYIQLPKEKSKEKPEVKVSILNSKGDTVRWFMHEPDSGFNQVRWGFDSNGIDWPSRYKREEKKSPPGGGFEVMPGTFKVVFTWGTEKDSSEVKMMYDPRFAFDPAKYESAKKQNAELVEVIKSTNQLLEDIRAKRKSIEIAKTAWTFVEDTLKKSLIAEADSMLTNLQSIENMIYAPEGERGIRDDSKYLMSDIYMLSGYVGTAVEETSANFLLAKNAAMRKYTTIQKRLDRVTTEQWKPWVEKAKRMEWKIEK